MNRYVILIAVLAIAVMASLLSAAAYARVDGRNGVLAAGSSAALSEGNSPSLEFRAVLSGAQEMPSVASETGGQFKMKFNSDLSEADFNLKVSDGLAVTEAHLHCGSAGANGPAKVFIYGPSDPVDVNGELSQGVLTNDDFIGADGKFIGADCRAFVERPVNNIASLALAAMDGLIYVNVHTDLNPGGEVRGQLLQLGDSGD